MHDHFWLYNAPQCPNAVQWSQDNHIAVAAGHTVAILSPGHLDGARAFAATPVTADVSALQVDGVPEDAEASANLLWAVAAELKASDPQQAQKVHVRSLAWSPAGCTPQGGCLLTVVTTDSKVGCDGRCWGSWDGRLECGWAGEARAAPSDSWGCCMQGTLHACANAAHAGPCGACRLTNGTRTCFP